MKYIIEFIGTLFVFFFIGGFYISNKLYKTKATFHTIFIEEKDNGDIRVLVAVLNKWVNPFSKMGRYVLMPFHNYRNLNDALESAERIKHGMLKDKIYSKMGFEPVIINVPDINSPHGKTFIENYYKEQMLSS